MNDRGLSFREFSSEHWQNTEVRLSSDNEIPVLGLWKYYFLFKVVAQRIKRELLLPLMPIGSVD